MTTTAGRPPARTGAPHGEAAVRAALLEAAANLFADKGPSDVSVREVATRAGVNHGLVHYYFGSKDALLAAVLDACASDVARELEAGDGVTLLTEPDSAVVRHTRILAHVILGAGDPAALQHEFPTLDHLVAALTRQGLPESEARVRAAQVSALVLGWHLFGEFLTAAAGVSARGGNTDAVLPDGVARLFG